MAEVTQSPMMQQFLNDPETMRTIMQANPAIQQVGQLLMSSRHL